ncbi:lipopolysaccharide transport periplasmic protein LptA [Shewanella sp. WXL01]|uniref:lipopolysaccharide transport periplasmic protein LptA n=1 Tax=Shewanella sp. WXL01 TaxID=2709721 RepID=UPI001FD87D81|nr:lipopolysaccharide transport periplasmic protein LptA [Shewanella sp. WXL01]
MLLASAIVALGFVSPMSSLEAKEGDLQQQVKISSVSQKADIKNNQIIFYGPVTVVQGSINIQADELRAFTSDNSVTKTLVATGNPATFSQELDDGKIGTASASEVRYDLASTTLTLTGKAKLDQAGSQVTGDIIRYNIDKQELIAQSKGDERVITIIQPENFQDPSEQAPVEQQPEPQTRIEQQQEPSTQGNQ